MINPEVLPEAAALLLGVCVILLLLALHAFSGRSEARRRLDQAKDAQDAAARRIEDLERDVSQAAQSHAQLEQEQSQILAQLQDAHRDAEDSARRLAVLSNEIEHANRAQERLERDLVGQRDARADAEVKATQMGERIAALQTELSQSQKHNAETLKRVSDMNAAMEERFKQMAEASVQAQGDRLSKMSNAQLTALLSPLKDHIGRFETELRGVHKKADEERSLLKQEIGLLTQRSQQLSQDAQSLTKALRGDSQKQGAWGEMVLERLLESSGLEKGVHYETQVSAETESGKRARPDVIVRLPEDRLLVIDSKVSLVSYERALASEDAEVQAREMDGHVVSLRRHIDQLSAKAYETIDGSMPDYVVMFVPIEGALSDALRHAKDLTTYALEKNVTIATPTTLMMALRTISHVWLVDTRNRNAELIAQEAGRLYDKLSGFTDNMAKVGRALEQASKAHEEAVGQLSTGRGNALAKAEKIKAMGAKTTKALAYETDPDVDPLSVLDGGKA
jgi:DNA recombination protein RmuC